MPFKANAGRRHHIPRQRHKAKNWAGHDAGLGARGSLTGWFAAEAVEGWRARARDRGGQPEHRTWRLEPALTLRAVFRLVLRRTEGLIGPINAA